MLKKFTEKMLTGSKGKGYKSPVRGEKSSSVPLSRPEGINSAPKPCFGQPCQLPAVQTPQQSQSQGLHRGWEGG